MSDDPANPYRESDSAHGPTLPGNRQDREPGDADSAPEVGTVPTMSDESPCFCAFRECPECGPRLRAGRRRERVRDRCVDRNPVTVEELNDIEARIWTMSGLDARVMLCRLADEVRRSWDELEEFT